MPNDRTVITRLRCSAAVLLCAIAAFVSAQARTAVTSLWPADTVPALVDSNDGNAVELGVRFRVSVGGHVTGVRYYKAAANIGTHVGSLWRNDGTLLARATFGNETTSGWQQADFDAPVPVTAGTTYIVSYHAPAGRYSATLDYFATSSHGNGPLTAPRDGLHGANGVYRYGAAPGFPDSTWRSANYWVDVVFEPAGHDSTPPSTPTQLQASAVGDTRLTLFWNESQDDIGVAQYQLYRDGGFLAATPATYHHDTSAEIGGTYTYAVRAADAAGNLSAFSTPLTVTFEPVETEGPVLPGSVGFRGEESDLILVDGPQNGSRNVPPAGCAWYAPEYGLHCRGDVVIDGYLIRGGVDHYGSGTLTVRDSVIEGQRNYQGIWLRKGSHCGATVTDTTLRWGGSTPPPQGNGAITDSEGCHLTLRRNDISGWADGIQLGTGGIIEDNHIHDLYSTAPAHNDGIQFFGDSDYVVTGNYISIGWGGPGSPQNAAIFMGAGNTTRPVFRHNFLSGGGYTLRSNSAQGVVFTDNILERLPQQFGDYDITPGTIAEWARNRRPDGTPVAYP